MGPQKTTIPWQLAAAVVFVGLLGFGVACRDRTPVPSENLIDPARPAKRFAFRDVTADSGIDFTYHNGQEANRYSILESLGGGVALVDYDGDGLLDVFVTGGGHTLPEAGTSKEIKRVTPAGFTRTWAGGNSATSPPRPAWTGSISTRTAPPSATTTATAGPTWSSPGGAVSRYSAMTPWTPAIPPRGGGSPTSPVRRASRGR